MTKSPCLYYFLLSQTQHTHQTIFFFMIQKIRSVIQTIFFFLKKKKFIGSKRLYASTKLMQWLSHLLWLSRSYDLVDVMTKLMLRLSWCYIQNMYYYFLFSQSQHTHQTPNKLYLTLQLNTNSFPLQLWSLCFFSSQTDLTESFVPPIVQAYSSPRSWQLDPHPQGPLFYLMQCFVWILWFLLFWIDI